MSMHKKGATATEVAVAQGVQHRAPRRAVSMMGESVSTVVVTRLSGIWTYNVPDHLWRTGNSGGGDGTVTSVDGALTMTSGTVDGGVTWIQSRAHPRYETDSPFGAVLGSEGLPIGTDNIFRFGLFTDWEGWYVSVDCSGSGTVEVYTRRTTGVVAPDPEDHTDGTGAATTASTLVATGTVPAGSDLSKCTLLDIYGQWRGVGNQLLLIDLIEAALSSRLGDASAIWCSNPALPLRFEFERKAGGSNETIGFGCSRVLSHNGSPREDEYDYVYPGSGEVTVDATERPVLVFQAAGFLGGMPCTRDHVITRVLRIKSDSKVTIRIRRNATISNSGVTWSIPYSDRGIVKGIGSNTATVTGGDVVFEDTWAADDTYDLEKVKHHIRPIEGTLTTGANRGDPAYGDTWVLTAEKATGGSAVIRCAPALGSLY